MRHLTGRRLWFAPLFIVGLALLVFVTMWLWNMIMHGVFSLPLINFWQTAGLLILSRLLFGFHHWGGYSRHRNFMREKWHNMTPEQREEFAKRFKEHHHGWGHYCGYHKEATSES